MYQWWWLVVLILVIESTKISNGDDSVANNLTDTQWENLKNIVNDVFFNNSYILSIENITNNITSNQDFIGYNITNTLLNTVEDIFQYNISAVAPLTLEESSGYIGFGSDIFYLNASQLIKMHNFSVEEHRVTTEDGYILNIQRIPKQNASAVLIVHGVLDSADTWLVNSADPQKCLPFMLSTAGYDVWLGNTRGNKYSRYHETLNPSEREFWKFSFDELGKYDLPAMIDLILETTNQEDLYYIGHSQGTSSFYAMCSFHPEYNSKIKLMTSLAPVAWMAHAFTPLVTTALVTPLSVAGVPEALESVGLYEILPSSILLSNLMQLLCSKQSITQPLCVYVLFEFFGYDYQELNTTRLAVYLSHTPAGASIRQIAHFFQGKSSKEFRRYNHGESGNLEAYGSVTPPNYNVTNITAPVALFYGSQDTCSTAADVQNITDSFPNIVYDYLIPDFNHIDYLWGINASTVVYDKILELMSSY